MHRASRKRGKVVLSQAGPATADSESPQGIQGNSATPQALGLGSTMSVNPAAPAPHKLAAQLYRQPHPAQHNHRSQVKLRESNECRVPVVDDPSQRRHPTKRKTDTRDRQAASYTDACPCLPPRRVGSAPPATRTEVPLPSTTEKTAGQTRYKIPLSTEPPSK